MDNLGPLEILYCWQSIVLAVLIWTVTGSISAGLTLLVGKDRMQQKLVKKVLMPIVPLVVGAILGWFFPFKPDLLAEWVNNGNQNTVFLFYGVCVGHFADYLHTKINGVIKKPVDSSES